MTGIGPQDLIAHLFKELDSITEEIFRLEAEKEELRTQYAAVKQQLNILGGNHNG